jgi:sporulation protein YlmC with PRC-barrel domain
MNGRVLDLQRDLLDRQIVSTDGSLLGKVDDLELVEDDQGRLQVSALLVGSDALAARLEGRIGQWLRRVGHRLDRSATPGVRRLDYAMVVDVGSAVTIALAPDADPVSRLESWVAEHVVRHIPGSRHESE